MIFDLPKRFQELLRPSAELVWMPSVVGSRIYENPLNSQQSIEIHKIPARNCPKLPETARDCPRLPECH